MAEGTGIRSGGPQCFLLGAAVSRGHGCLLEDVSSQQTHWIQGFCLWAHPHFVLVVLEGNFYLF